MLGLKLNSLSRRNRRSLASSPAPETAFAAPDASSEDLPQEAVMTDARAHTDGLTVTALKPEVAISVNEVSESDLRKSVERLPPQSQQTQRTVLTRTSSYKATHVYETTRTLIHRITYELDDVDDEHFTSITLDSYLEFIADERLYHMPRKGSQWDRVLRAAEYFGVQIDRFSDVVAHFVPESQYIARGAYGSLHLLLELGHKQAEALEPTFIILQDFGRFLAQVVSRHELVSADRTIKEDISDIFSALVSLIGEIALHYRQRINSMSSHQSGSIDFEATFGKTIRQIWAKKEHLSNHMWSLKLRHKRHAMSIESVRRRLSPVDSSVDAILYGRLAERAERVEGTCEWIQGYLLDFLRSNESTFTITGASGWGKSVLAGWIKERLQQPLGRVSYETISYTFPHDALSQTKPLAFLQNICSQLLERNVGDVQLFELLVVAFEAYDKSKDGKKLEKALWDGVEAGLKSLNDHGINMIIIVDGLDEVTGESAAKVHKRLHECVDKYSRARAITLSKPLSFLGSEGYKRTIAPENTHNDMTKYLRAALSQCQHFYSQNQRTQESFIEDLATKAKGSFIYSFAVSKILGLENSYESFWKTGHDMPSELAAVLKRLIAAVDLKNSTTKHMLSFMLVTQRPLTVAEMEDLLSIDVHKRTIHSRTDIRKHIATHCRSLVIERQGLIRFKHAEVQEYLKKHIAGHGIMSLKEADSELTKRMLFYAKHTLTATYEPSFEILGGGLVDETFRAHSLVQYVSRYWLSHFRRSSFCGAKHELHLSDEFKAVFPDSTLFAMIEWSCWQRQFALDEARELHDLALRIRTACFGEKHVCVMQSLIIMGCSYRSYDVTRASEFFYRASMVGQSVLSKFSAVVVTCVSTFLTITETITVTTRTTVVTYREEMIRFMIEICKTKYGKSSDRVIKWYEVLAQLYITIKEEWRATIVYKELYEILVVRFGPNHPKVKGLGANIRLHGGESDEDVLKYNGWIFGGDDEVDTSRDLRVDVILKLILEYESKSKWVLAERLYITLWRRVSELCRVKGTIEFHMMKIQVALAYVHFLQRIKRVEEACSILIALWAEYEHHAFEEMTIILRIKEIGVVCRRFGLLAVAVSIFAKVWGWFKGHGKTEHEEATSVTILITEVVEEIEETTITKRTTTTTTTTVTETLTREIFETTYTRCKHGKVDVHFFKACMALINLYIKQEKWSECEVIIKRSLELTWKAVLTVDAKLTLTGTYMKECIIVATQLAICYHRQRQFVKAEEIYLRIYRACLLSFSIDHVCVSEASYALIRFYEEYHRHDKVIEIYIELLHGYRKHCGATHALTIKTLYALGAICMTLGRKDAYEYYIEIVRVLNKGKHCHHDAFEAAIIVCGYYYEEHRWTELREICTVLWETFVHHHHEFKFTEAMIITLYERYRYVLEFHAKVEFSVLYKLSVQFKETVIVRFGASAAIVITALIALASICEMSEEHWHESVTIYEEIITKTTTTTTTTTVVEETIIKTVKKRLSKMYVTIITKGKTTNKTTMERGIAIALELYESLKIEFGCWHETTLIQLRELCILYKKHGTKESHAHSIRLLQLAVIEVITTVTTSITLYTAATSLAAIYVSCGLVKLGQDLLHQLRHLIVLHDMGATKDITISLGGKVSKIAFVFLLAFERRLTEKVVLSYSEVMLDILLETHLYEEYIRVIKVETKIEIVLEVSARLRSFWFARSRKAQCEILDRKLFAMFTAKYANLIHVHDDFVFMFYAALLGELGKDRAEVDFAISSCAAANAKVKSLLEAGEFHKAHEVAKCAFQFISGHKWYQKLKCVGYGYRLAEYMAGIGTRYPTDETLRKAMRETSRAIVTEVLASCRAAKINFVSLQFEDITGLVRLLGAQENYTELEQLLEELWRSREVQKTWSPDTVLSIGRLLVHAHYAAGHPARAIELCDMICYNLRRSRGWLHPSAMAMSRLLSELYTAQHRHREAMAVHEEVLRELDEDGDAVGGAGERKRAAHDFVELLRRAFQRLGGFDKHESRYQTLVGTVKRRFDLPVQPVERWEAKGADSFGEYHPPTEWQLGASENQTFIRSPPGSIRRAAVGRTCGYASWSEKMGSRVQQAEVVPVEQEEEL